MARAKKPQLPGYHELLEKAKHKEIKTGDPDIDAACASLLESTNIDISTNAGYTAILLHISDYINIYIDSSNAKTVEDIDYSKLDYYYSVFLRISSVCNITPTLDSFLLMVKLIDIKYNQDSANSTLLKRLSIYTGISKKMLVETAAAAPMGAAGLLKMQADKPDEIRNDIRISQRTAESIAERYAIDDKAPI